MVGRALYDVAVKFPAVLEEEVSKQEPLRWRRGVCDYIGIAGIYEVEDGVVAVQTTHENISTNRQAWYSAKILDEKSLLAIYRERAQRYAKPAKEIEG